MLVLSDVTKIYAESVALDGLSLSVPEDSYVTLLGASGSGKTTLLRLIAGFEEPDVGQIMLDGQRLDGIAPHQRDIGFVFQNFALFPHMSVADNIGYGLRYRAVNPITDAAELAHRIAEAVDLVGLKGLERRSTSSISGGQQQRVALARTLITEPRIVLLDEPLGALDANLRERMCDELRAIRERLGVTFLHVTGSETEALIMGDEVAVLASGKVEQSASPTTLYSQPRTSAAARHLNAYNVLSGVTDGAVIKADFGSIPSTPASAMTTGTPVEFALRFDHIDVLPISASLPPGKGELGARFLTAEFNGPSVLCFFRLGNGVVVQVVDHHSAPRNGALVEGQDYRLTFDPTDIIVYSERAA